MTDRNQGEGDYESARRYNKEVRKTVRRGIPDHVPEAGLSEAALETAESAGKARAKNVRHDQKDAELMKHYVKDKKQP